MPPAEVLLEENAQLKGEIASRDSIIASKSERIAELEAQIAWLRRQAFGGGKSERIDPAQLDFLEGVLEEAKAEAEKVETASYERRASKPRRGREEIYGHLPVLGETVVEPAEVASSPDGYERIGEEETFEVRIDPPRFYRHRIVRPKYRRKADKSLPPVVAPAPARVVDGIASAQLLAYVAVSKFCDHLPLSRQCSIYKRHGISLQRQTLVRWVERIADWLKPIYAYMLIELLEGGYLQVDETPIRYCDPDYGESRSRSGYLCGLSRPKSNACFKWSPSRSHASVTGHLAKFKGVMQSDMYGAYVELAEAREDVELAACWAHARRKFFEAKDRHPRECKLVLALIGRLYAAEREIRSRREDDPESFGDAEALGLRVELASNSHARIKRVLEILRRRTLLQSELGKACSYALDHWGYLSTYLRHGHVHIDNNHMENAIRPSAVGKKNWLFVGHPEAGDRAAILYSVTVTCQRLGIDPLAYLTDILSRNVPMLSAKEQAALTPANWKKQAQAEGRI